MSAPYIVDTQLPVSQDFRALKAIGLEYVQQHSGNEWTNLNPSDPGVTILDQVCFALTELGYCNDFSIRDILTDRNEKLQISDQFYLPEKIMTTSPVTAEDYRKYLIDGVQGVDNAIITVASGTAHPANSIYQVYLLCDSAADEEARNNICQAAFFYLNRCRNVGEIFLMPLSLQALSYQLNGSIEIENEIDLVQVLDQLQIKIQDYIFPAVKSVGYNQLIGKDLATEEIFNGPLLQNGWIPAEALGKKRSRLRIAELINLMESVPGVSVISELTFGGKTPFVREIISDQPEILNVDLLKSARDGNLEVYCKGTKLNGRLSQNLNFSSGKSPGFGTDLVFGARPDVLTTLPEGKFRDINTYYSIQNTFPEIFGVGINSVVSNATDFQMAQSRQLKGYLTLFDQVLANQFSQLANLEHLFSFKNSSCGTPSDRNRFYEIKDAFKRDHPEYPVPYRSFSPTYFYQSLYEVPYIKPLLKDNDAFNYSYDVEPDPEAEQKAWTRYKDDPYNPYILGLMNLMDEEREGLVRRNNILDHLLARHGESSLIIDAIIEGTVYSGDSVKDQVILKSLYLQNLGLLSYFRQKACNFITAAKIEAELPALFLNPDHEIFGDDFTDFIFNSQHIDKVEKLHEQDFSDYSAIELKLSLLFGLKVLYRNYMISEHDRQQEQVNLQLALWMIRQRKGLIFIETSMLKHQAEDQSPTSDNEVILIFPDFIPALNTWEFKNRLDLFLQNMLPVQVSYAYRFVNAAQLKNCIDAYTSWHNGLLYEAGKYQYNNPAQVAKAENLLRIISAPDPSIHE